MIAQETHTTERYPGAYEEYSAAERERLQVEQEARELIAQREQLPLVEVKRPERLDNARTAIMEALTASGHLSVVEIHGASPEEIHRQVLSRLLRGYDETLPLHEQHRRFYEICEELIIFRTHQRIASGELPETAAVGIVSDLPVSPRLSDLQVQQLGYRQKNRKGMVRSTHLRSNHDGTYTRRIEQVSRSNSTDGSTMNLLESLGEQPDLNLPPDIAALARPFTYDIHDIHDGVVDLQRRLDWFAGVKAGCTLRYGEEPHKGQLEYHELREGSLEREAQVEFYVQGLADYEARLDRQLQEGKITRAERDGHYNEEVLRILRAICLFSPDYAEDCFGSRAAAYYGQAATYELIGDVNMRDIMLRKAENHEEPVIYCGVMISAEKAKELGIVNTETGELIESGKKNWGYKKGFCRVQGCKYRRKKTEVGPCQVCKKCEKKFDSGELK